MCYYIKANLEAQLSRENRNGDLQAISEIKEKLVPLTDFPIYCATGFNLPCSLVINPKYFVYFISLN